MTLQKQPSLFHGALLVAGTTIGGGMLALPVMTGLGGFIPSIFIYLLCWAFMFGTGLLFLEVSQWVGNNANLVTMAETTLGVPGKIAAWFLYLFLFYCLTLAYVVGCGELIGMWFPMLPDWAGPWVFAVLASPLVFAGAKVVGKLNVFLMLGLGLSFLFFVVLGAPYVKWELLKYANWPGSLIALPICFTSFAYQGIIPTLVEYMHHDIARSRRAILIGTLIPLFGYILWQWLILGIIPPEGPHGLINAMHLGQNAVQPLSYVLDNPLVYAMGEAFAFFALVTSFFGVTLGLVDFLADGLGLEKNNGNKLGICLGIFIPVLLIQAFNPHVFLRALELAGGIGCAALLGLMPILMVISGRYKQGRTAGYHLKGGGAILTLMLLFVLFELGWNLFY
jgi:tyrosine-specific transport protein